MTPPAALARKMNRAVAVKEVFRRLPDRLFYIPILLNRGV